MADIEQDASFGISNFRLIIKLLIEHGCLLLIGTETNSFPLQTEHQHVRFCALAPLLAPARQNRIAVIASVETMTTHLSRAWQRLDKEHKRDREKRKKEYVTVLYCARGLNYWIFRKRESEKPCARERERLGRMAKNKWVRTEHLTVFQLHIMTNTSTLLYCKGTYRYTVNIRTFPSLRLMYRKDGKAIKIKKNKKNPKSYHSHKPYHTCLVLFEFIRMLWQQLYCSLW